MLLRIASPLPPSSSLAILRVCAPAEVRIVTVRFSWLYDVKPSRAASPSMKNLNLQTSSASAGLHLWSTREQAIALAHESSKVTHQLMP